LKFQIPRQKLWIHGFFEGTERPVLGFCQECGKSTRLHSIFLSVSEFSTALRFEGFTIGSVTVMDESMSSRAIAVTETANMFQVRALPLLFLALMDCFTIGV